MAIDCHTVGVVDYGTGNLRSVVKAFEYLGARVRVLQTPEGLEEIDALVSKAEENINSDKTKLEFSEADLKGLTPDLMKKL